MDPLFERRELARTIHLDSKYLTRNINTSILAQLRHIYEGTCIPEGYVQRDSIVVTDYSLGRMNLIRGGLDYFVKFQADLCMPHPGQVFRGAVSLKSKIGVHVDVSPMRVLLPRDLHIGNTDFEDINEKQEVEFEIIGAKFQPRDKEIVVLAKLRTLIQPDAPKTPEKETRDEAILAAPVGQADGQQERRTVTVDASAAKVGEGVLRRRRIRRNEENKTNE